MLLEKGFPIDEIDEVCYLTPLAIYYPSLQKGETPLHVAYKKGSHRVQGVLIAEDANQSIKNKVISAAYFIDNCHMHYTV